MAIIRGTAFGDDLVGSAASDLMNGFAGNDALEGLDGAPQTDAFIQDSDTLDGGAGLDTASYSQVQHGMFVNLFQGLAFGKGNVDELISIENVPVASSWVVVKNPTTSSWPL